MKITLTLEDTTLGVRAVVNMEGNGVTDHRPSSLATLLAANLSNTLKELERIHALVLIEPQTETK